MLETHCGMLFLVPVPSKEEYSCFLTTCSSRLQTTRSFLVNETPARLCTSVSLGLSGSLLDGFCLKLVGGGRLGPALVPKRRGENLLLDAPVGVPLGDIADLTEQSLLERDRLQPQVAKFGVRNVKLVLRGFGTRILEELDLRAALVLQDVGDVPDTAGLGHLVKDLYGCSRLRRVVQGDLDAPCRIADVDEGPRLPAGAVHRERHV
mmetsp:Transcript_4752/g.19004  ORF Transcript_4752/g.19004 Transcript_4752/m.19004 type:complete len:207 (-) Transcript_4752:1002-1622(-)